MEQINTDEQQQQNQASERASTLTTNLKTVLSKVQTAFTDSQKPTKKAPTLIAVSKTKPASDIKILYDQSQRFFGENYVEELLEKQKQLPEDIKWHFIGHLQSNKVNKLITPQLYCLQTIDSVKLANKVNENIRKKGWDRPLRVYVQVKTSEEESKAGVVGKEELFGLIETVHEKCEFLLFAGLMTIGMSGDLSVFEVNLISLERFLGGF